MADNATYFRHIIDGDEIILQRVGDLLRSFPADPANSDYQQYLEWVAEGNTAEPWPPAE